MPRGDQLSLPELLSLHLGGRFLAPLQATQFGAPIRTALDKIAATLAPAAREFLGRLDRELSARDPSAKDYSRWSDTWRGVSASSAADRSG